MGFLQNKPIRIVLAVMTGLVILVSFYASFHYRKVNESIDPRIIEARTLYDAYNNYVQVYEDTALFRLLDSIESVYRAIDHYRNSYETGVLHNNRAAIYLSRALAPDSLELTNESTRVTKDSLLQMAKTEVDSAITIYEAWKNKYAGKNETELRKLLQTDFFSGLENYTHQEQDEFFEIRLKELQTAQHEIKRRLSVSYTNLGIIYRHSEDYTQAAACYKEAIDLWDRNLSAENNLRILLDQPPVKESFIRRLFPPDKNEK